MTIEGHSIKTNDGDIFDIRGNYHPKDGYIAYLKYYFDRGKNKYKEIHTPEDGFNYLKKYKSDYLLNKNNVGYQYVKHSRIKKAYNPILKLKETIKSAANDKLQKKITKFAKILQNYGLNLEHIGVSGSTLVDLHNPNKSDIDLTIYGLKNCKKYLKVAKKLFEKKILDKYTKNNIRKLYLRHNRSTKIDWDTFLKMNLSKLTQGYIDDIEFFVKLVDPKFRESIFDAVDIQKNLELDVEIKQTKNSITTPGSYLVDDSKIDRIVFFRSRFSSINPCKVKICGNIEKIKNGEIRFILGDIIKIK